MTSTPDERRSREFGRKLLSFFTGSVLTSMIEIGYRTGLFDAAARGPATSPQLAERAGLQERYVREWLGAMVTGGIFEHDAATGRYSFPPEHGALLAGGGARNAAPMSLLIGSINKQRAAIAEAFRAGGGVPYSQYRPDFTEAMDDVWRRIYDEHLLTGFLPAAPGVVERLTAGIRVVDIGCGTGHAVNLMAAAFPASQFMGYDLAEDGIATAQEEAKRLALSNAWFEILDVTRLPADPPFDLITAFDAVHDQVAPDVVLARVSSALAPGGTFLMVDFKLSSELEKNRENPFAALYYSISTMHCMTVSLAHGGAGLGTVWGTELAQEMLRQAGFTRVQVLDSPRPQNCIYVCQK